MLRSITEWFKKISAGHIDSDPQTHADGATALGPHDSEGAVSALKEIGIDDGLATKVVNELARMSQSEAERRIATLIAAGKDPRSDNILTAYLILKHTREV